MRQDIYYAPDQNFTGEVDIFRNGASSSYQALQAQFRHRFAHGLQALLSYTWAHAIDDVSSDVNSFQSAGANVPPSAHPEGPGPVPERLPEGIRLRNRVSRYFGNSVQEVGTIQRIALLGNKARIPD
jgi:hypothetical protein